jgi:glycosyltransferase involved in cell wall biosynthesis
MVPSLRAVNNDLTIAHVLTSLCVGGGERVALLLAIEQLRRGHRVVVVSLEAPLAFGPLTIEFEQAGVKVCPVPKRAGSVDLTLSARLYQELRREGVDVVHTHNQLPMIYAALPGRLCGARVVHTEHGAQQSSPSQLWLRRAAAQLPHSFVAVSDATADFVREQRLGVDSKLRVILNATDLERFVRDTARRSAIRASWGIEPDVLAIGTVGRMAEVKNHPLLLRAAAPLLGKSTVLVFVGDGDARSATEALARELGVFEHCRFLGEVRNVAEVLSGLDLFALSSHSEGLPMSLAEAMGASLPIVATAVGGVPKVVVEGETGFLVEAGNADAMRERFEQMRDDRTLATRFGLRGYEVAKQRYSLQRLSDEYLGAYRMG